MPIPKNPETIIVKNKYYPKGLTEGDIWNYYQKNKWKLIKELNNRTVFFEIVTDLNTTVIRRKGKDGKLFYLNSSNFDEIITGRTLVIHSVMNKSENIGIIDIDTDDYKWAQQATYEVYNFVKNNGINIVSDAHIRFTGKTSFHVFCNIPGKKRDIELIKHQLKYSLLESDLSKKYTIEAKRRPGIPNLDLSSNKVNGGFMSLYSLSRFGLSCTEVPVIKILSFRPEHARIK